MTPTLAMLLPAVLLAQPVAAGRVGPCDGAHSGERWCDASAPVDERVAALVKALTTGEKAGLLSNTAQPVPRLGLPAYDWWNEAVHGFARVQFINGSDTHVNATSFPMSIGVSSSFNKTLWREVGAVVGREARGAANADIYGLNALTFWAPNINIARDSRWGRNQETPGEDPLTNGEYASQLAHGMQGTDPKWLQISACAKHYAVHSWNTPSTYMAYPTKQDLADTYLPAFEAAVKAGISGFMCSCGLPPCLCMEYNGVDGMPMCAQSDLLPKVRNEWGFNGYITSDCGAVGNPNYQRAGWTSPKDMISKSLAAGLDSDCGNGRDTWADSMNASLADGDVPMSLADAAITRLFKVQFRLGIFDKPEAQPSWAKYGAETVNTPLNRETVLAAAAQGLVLLVNKGKALPLRKSNVKTLALVGPNVQNIVTKDCGARKEPSYLGCEGCYCANAIDPVSPRDGFASHAAIEYVAGCSTILCDPSEKSKPGGWDDAAAAAGKADATVVIIGLDVTQECEGHDRLNVTAPGGQNEFVAQVCNAAARTKKPCIVLVMAGSAVDLSEIEALSSVGAMMWVGYPGERGGEAIANAVFGVSDEFGKLSYSIYRQSYYDKLSPLDFSMRPNGTDNPGRTYSAWLCPALYTYLRGYDSRFYNGSGMLHPFGTGLQYNDWTIDSVETSRTQLSASEIEAVHAATPIGAIGQAALPSPPIPPILTITTILRHTGEFDHSSLPVLLFARSPRAGQDGQPLRSLVAFERVAAAKGEPVRVDFQLDAKRLMLADDTGDFHSHIGEWTLEVHASRSHQQKILVIE